MCSVFPVVHFNSFTFRHLLTSLLSLIDLSVNLTVMSTFLGVFAALEFP